LKSNFKESKVENVLEINLKVQRMETHEFSISFTMRKTLFTSNEKWNAKRMHESKNRKNSTGLID